MVNWLKSDVYDMKYWLVIWTPLKNDGVHQLGSWHSQSMESHNPFMFQTTNQWLLTMINHDYPILNQCSSHHQAVNQMICKTQHPVTTNHPYGTPKSNAWSVILTYHFFFKICTTSIPHVQTHPHVFLYWQHIDLYPILCLVAPFLLIRTYSFISPYSFLYFTELMYV